MRADSRDGGGGVRRTQGEREREKAREKWGNHYHFSTSLAHLMYPRGNGSNWSLLAADRKQIDSSGGDMRGCLWPPCISKRVGIVNVHSCVTQYGNAIMHPSALNSIFPEEAPLHVCVSCRHCVLCFSSPRVFVSTALAVASSCWSCGESGLINFEESMLHPGSEMRGIIAMS